MKNDLAYSWAIERVLTAMAFTKTIQKLGLSSNEEGPK